MIDERHRGSAKDESGWCSLLEYFAPAAQLGLTATPKRKRNADTCAYFGEPVYTYALRDGIEDGFLTPFKVRRMASTIDEYVHESSDTVLAGEVKDGETSSRSDFNSRIIIPERELSRVQEFMGQIDQRQKALALCANQNHAALVRDLINQVKTSTNHLKTSNGMVNPSTPSNRHRFARKTSRQTLPTLTLMTVSRRVKTLSATRSWCS